MQNKSDIDINRDAKYISEKAMGALNAELGLTLSINRHSFWNGLSFGVLTMVFLYDLLMMMLFHKVGYLIWAASVALVCVWDYHQYKKRRANIIHYYETIMEYVSQIPNENGEGVDKGEE